MEDVTLAHAKEHLEELVRRAAAGEEVRISDPEVGTVVLAAVNGQRAGPMPERKPGQWKGRFTVPERLFEPLTDEELAWLSGERSE